MRLIRLLSIAAAMLLPATASLADETRVMVRALAHDAKLIGTSMGGARVLITDAANGEVLAQGTTEGATGSTAKIMSEPHQRGMVRFNTEGAAGFLATLDLAEPTTVDVHVSGPLDYPQSQSSAKRRLVLLPGQHLEGEGVVITLSGFVVEILSPAEQEPDTSSLEREISVRTRVRMMCGCPTQPGGMWDSDDYQMSARLLLDDQIVASAPLAYAGRSSEFTAALMAPGDGEYRVEVLVVDPAKGNTGRAVRRVQIGVESDQ